MHIQSSNYTPGRGKIVPRNVINYTPGRGKIVPRNIMQYNVI